MNWIYLVIPEQHANARMIDEAQAAASTNNKVTPGGRQVHYSIMAGDRKNSIIYAFSKLYSDQRKSPAQNQVIKQLNILFQHLFN